MYMYCRSSTRYCRPQEVSNPRRFIRYHTLPTPIAINLRPHQLPKVTAAVYVLPKSILPPFSMKITHHSDLIIINGDHTENSPIHSHSTLFSHSLDILLVKVKGSSRSGICLAEALSDTATPVKKLPINSDNQHRSPLGTSMGTHLLGYKRATTTRKRLKTTKNNWISGEYQLSSLTPSEQVSVSILFINNTDTQSNLSDVKEQKAETGNGKVFTVCVRLLVGFTQNSAICVLAPISPAPLR